MTTPVFTYEYQPRSLEVSIDALENLAKSILNTGDERHRPSFEVKYTNKKGKVYSDLGGLHEELKNGPLRRIIELSFSCWSNSTNVSFRYNGDLTQLLTGSIKTSNVNHYQSMIDAFEKLSSRNSLNFVLHSSWAYTVVPFFLSCLLVPLMIYVRPHFLLEKDIFLLSLYGIIIITFLISLIALPRIIRLYPILVIKGKHENSGRILRNDAKNLTITIGLLVAGDMFRRIFLN